MHTYGAPEAQQDAGHAPRGRGRPARGKYRRAEGPPLSRPGPVDGGAAPPGADEKAARRPPEKRGKERAKQQRQAERREGKAAREERTARAPPPVAYRTLHQIRGKVGALAKAREGYVALASALDKTAYSDDAVRRIERIDAMLGLVADALGGLAAQLDEDLAEVGSREGRAPAVRGDATGPTPAFPGGAPPRAQEPEAAAPASPEGAEGAGLGEHGAPRAAVH